MSHAALQLANIVSNAAAGQKGRRVLYPFTRFAHARNPHVRPRGNLEKSVKPVSTFSSRSAAKTVVHSGNLTIHYSDRIRFKAPSQIQVQTVAPRPGNFQLTVSGPCFTAAKISQVTPQPATSQPLSEGAIYTFELPGGGPAEITLRLEPGRPRAYKLPYRDKRRLGGLIVLRVVAAVLSSR
jgi:hypothetical protein